MKSARSLVRPENVHVFDIETKTDFKTFRLGGLLKPTTNSGMFFLDQNENDVEEKLRLLPKHSILVTWNGARFDIPHFQRKAKYLPVGDFIHFDLMIAYKILFFNERKFSLAHWAQKVLGEDEQKLCINYDSDSIADLSVYLKRDLEITYKLFKHWVVSVDQFGLDFDKLFTAVQIETRAAEIAQEQVDIGVRFDVDKAFKLSGDLHNRIDEIREELEKHHFPFIPIPENKLDYPPKIQFRQDGSPSKLLQNYLSKYGYYADLTSLGEWQAHNPTDGTTLTLPLTHPIATRMQLRANMGKEIKEYLLDKGWQPTEWNKSKKSGNQTTPRLTLLGTGEPCPNLEQVGVTWGKLYREYLQASNRANVLKSDKGSTGWIKTAVANSFLPQGEYMIPSDGDTLGANTSRWTHKGIANVPRPKSYYGEEFRSLFRAREHMVWVGWDASALEARIEAHYTHNIDPSYALELVEGDVHTRTMMQIPLITDRDQAKKLKYMIMYGAQPAKIASGMGWSASQAEQVYNEYWQNNPALSKLKSLVESAWISNGKQSIIGLDGRPIYTRSKHSLLNALFQSGGAIVMKYAMVMAHHRIRARYPDYREARGLIRYHDEEVWEACPQAAGDIAGIGVASIAAAGKHLGLKVPLEGKAKIGQNWLEVH